MCCIDGANLHNVLLSSGSHRSLTQTAILTFDNSFETAIKFQLQLYENLCFSLPHYSSVLNCVLTACFNRLLLLLDAFAPHFLDDSIPVACFLLASTLVLLNELHWLPTIRAVRRCMSNTWSTGWLAPSPSSNNCDCIAEKAFCISAFCTELSIITFLEFMETWKCRGVLQRWGKSQGKVSEFV